MALVANGKPTIVGVADLAVGKAPGQIVTYALGSCIGVSVWDPVTKVGGMLHYMLPQPGDETEPGFNPAQYGTTGVPLLFKRLAEAGGAKARVVVCAAGGAEILNDDGTFRVGSRNRTLLRKIFWKNNVLIHAEDTGGNNCRTLSLRTDDGCVEIRSQGKVKKLWPE